MTRTEITNRLKQMIVRRLQLKIQPDEIQEAAALFQGGLGLDSVEALELVVGIEEEFGVNVDNGESTKKRFFSVDTLSDYVLELLGAVA